MLTERELKLALHCANEELRARKDGKAPGVRSWNAELVRRLELELGTSRAGHECVCVTEESTSWLSARQAATRLGLSKRQIERRHADLDAQLIDDRFWIFPAGVVTEYARRQHDD